jgi:epoxyqueuosine reductase
MFGCDICQDVCPWNRFAENHKENQFLPSEQLLEMHKNYWEDITEEVFKKLFKDSPLKRTKYSGIKRNLEFIKMNSVTSKSDINS